MNDGTPFHIVKRDLDPADLFRRLERAGFHPRIEKTIAQFQFAIATKA